MARIVFDVDGVLADFVLGFRLLANKYFGFPVYGTLQQAQWDMQDLAEEQQDFLWENVGVMPNNEFWLTLPSLITESEWENLRGFAMTHDVYFVTNRFHPSAKWDTEEWLGRHGVNHATVILSDRKGDIARAIQANFLLDDKAGNAIYAAYASPDTRVFLLDRQYNQFSGSVVGSRVQRVKTVADFLALANDGP